MDTVRRTSATRSTQKHGALIDNPNSHRAVFDGDVLQQDISQFAGEQAPI
jgi:hypothetical protein